MLSALIKVHPRKDGSVLDPLAIVPTKGAVGGSGKIKASKQPKAPKASKAANEKKEGGVKRQRKAKVVPASDNEDDEADFSEFVPLENVPKSHYEGYIDEDTELDCGVLSQEQGDDDVKQVVDWSEFVKEEEKRYDEEYETSSVASQDIESSLSSSVDPDDYGFDTYDAPSTDDETFSLGEDDDFTPSRKKKEKEFKVKTFTGISIVEDDDWIP